MHNGQKENIADSSIPLKLSGVADMLSLMDGISQHTCLSIQN